MLFQDIIPAVDGLLSKTHNAILITLLYRLAEWHALAKLRMHTEHTLECLEKSTTTIGQELRKFRDISLKDFKCVELPKETAAQKRRKENAQAKKAQANQSKATSTDANVPVPQANIGGDTQNTTAKKDEPLASKPKPKPKPKTLNLFTYKFHALGDYVRTIRLFGTTDSYSTQIVSTILFFIFRL